MPPRTNTIAQPHRNRRTIRRLLYDDGLFILYKHDDKNSIYAKFTNALTRHWCVEDKGPVTDLLNIEIERDGDTI